VITSKIRVYVTGAEATRSRIVEVEAYGASTQQSGSNIEWLVTDQLGTPRMVADKSGSLAGISRGCVAKIILERKKLRRPLSLCCYLKEAPDKLRLPYYISPI
jgi:hypothetical protein